MGGCRMFAWVKRFFATRYVGMLEGELVRLRAENRALMNSLLGTAGFPPVEFPEAVKPVALPRLRKRSWHQIQAWRQAGAAQEEAIGLDGRTDERTHGLVPHS